MGIGAGRALVWRAISLGGNLTAQDFDALPYPPRPRLRALGAGLAGGRPRVTFQLTGRASVRAWALPSPPRYRPVGGIAPRALGPGRRALTLARLPRGGYRAVVQACTRNLGCVEAISRWAAGEVGAETGPPGAPHDSRADVRA